MADGRESTTRRVFSGAPWESRVGYCRAIRVGDVVAVTGTAPLEPDGSVHRPGDAYGQAVRCFEIIRAALEELDLGMESVVRTRMFVTDIGRWEEVGRAHAEVFRKHPPATTMVEVSRLIHPDMLVEVEADAVG